MRDVDMNLKEFLDLVGWSKNKFYDNIERMCSKEIYNIEVGKFRKVGRDKEEYYKDEKDFHFRKEWIDIAYVLFTLYSENPFYRKNSDENSVTLEEILKYNDKSLDIVKKHLHEYHRRQVMAHPVYQTTIMESVMLKGVSDKISLLTSAVSKMPIETRTIAWKYFNDAIDHVLIHSYLQGIDIKEAIEEEKGNLYKDILHGEFEHTSLDKFIAETLKKEMDKNFREKRDKVNELYYEAQDEMDRVYIEMCGDTPEDIKEINERFEELKLEEVVKITRGLLMEREIQDNIKKAIEMGKESISIDTIIDDTIEEIKKRPDKESIKQIEKLKEVKLIINDNLKDITSFNNDSDTLLTKIQYNIINRQS